MHAILSSSMAAMLLCQAVFGLCCHGPHECHIAGGQFQVACCHHHERGCSHGQPAGPCKCKLQCQGVCTYLATQKAKIDSPHTLNSLDVAAIVPNLLGDQQIAGPAHDAAHGPPEAEPPVRLHLLHQVILA